MRLWCNTFATLRIDAAKQGVEFFFPRPGFIVRVEIPISPQGAKLRFAVVGDRSCEDRFFCLGSLSRQAPSSQISELPADGRGLFNNLSRCNRSRPSGVRYLAAAITEGAEVTEGGLLKFKTCDADILACEPDDLSDSTQPSSLAGQAT